MDNTIRLEKIIQKGVKVETVTFYLGDSLLKSYINLGTNYFNIKTEESGEHKSDCDYYRNAVN